MPMNFVPARSAEHLGAYNALPSSPHQASLLPQMAQLDALRAFAIFGVFITHFAPEAAVFDLGGAGVRLFFVLSGFLITRILLVCADLVRSGRQGMGFTLRQFYCRRVL